MGNYYANELLGKTLDEANNFIKENKVYFNAENKYRILEIRVKYPGCFYTMEYCYNRLNVKVNEDNEIYKIINMG